MKTRNLDPIYETKEFSNNILGIQLDLFRDTKDMFQQKTIVYLLLIVVLANSIFAQKTELVPNNQIVAKIKKEGMENSEVMPIVRHLTDVIGPRLTNSPAQHRASKWTKEKLEKWGFKNSVIEPWGEFGRGWEVKKFIAFAKTQEEFISIRSYPKAWSPSTKGEVNGKIVYFEASNDAELEKYKGKLKGAIVLTMDVQEVAVGFEPTASRRTDQNLQSMERSKVKPATFQTGPTTLTPAEIEEKEFQERKARFLYKEGAAVLLEPSIGVDSGAIRVKYASFIPQSNDPDTLRVYSKEAPQVIPQLVVEVEQYNRLVRLAKDGFALNMTVNLEVKFYDDDLQGYNTIAEIPGTDLKDEVVIIGAHLDSYHAGTGATDNAVGVASVMEAVRIIKSLNIQPRRTIRIILWSGEEQGLLGSLGYVTKHYALIGDGNPGSVTREMLNGGFELKITRKPNYEKLAAYYNLDGGTGKIRGIYMQGNEALRPIFREWSEPFREMGASTVSVNYTGGTDHLSFDVVGLPGFQFIQDNIEYAKKTWHSTQDVYDRVLEDDLKHNAIIMATFVYNTAMMDKKFPSKINPLLKFTDSNN